MILGGPGSGKSTTLQFIGLCFARLGWATDQAQERRGHHKQAQRSRRGSELQGDQRSAHPAPVRGAIGALEDGLARGGSGTKRTERRADRHGAGGTVQLANWTLSDAANHVFTFPSFQIQPNQTCRVYTNEDHQGLAVFKVQKPHKYLQIRKSRIMPFKNSTIL